MTTRTICTEARRRNRPLFAFTWWSAPFPHNSTAGTVNLLPDNPDIRKRLGARFKVRTNTFDLLTAIGRDCTGAVQLLPMDAAPEGWDQIQAHITA